MTEFLVKYLYGNDTHYSYKTFDTSEKAIDYMLELKTKDTKKIKLYQTQEVEVEYKVEIKGLKSQIKESALNKILKEYNEELK
jgi:hypothetical protein